ncbi:hypothetical protein C8J56DRAFT_761013, partial [Mycena floridula]
FSLWHIPPLLIATALTFEGMIPFFNGELAIQDFGLPSSISTSEPAQVVMAVNGARTIALGLALFTLYKQKQLKALDTVMALRVSSTDDGWMCWQQGVYGKVLMRAGTG